MSALEPSRVELGLLYKDGKRLQVKVVDESTREERPITSEDIRVLAAQDAEIRDFEAARARVRNPRYRR